MTQEVSREEQVKWFNWWEAHIKRLKERDAVTDDELDSLRLLVGGPDQIGYGRGQIRPGKLGQWDAFYTMKEFVTREKRLLLSDLSDAEVKKAEDEWEMETWGYDPNNPEEVAEFHRLNGMSLEEFEAEVNRLRVLLVA